MHQQSFMTPFVPTLAYVHGLSSDEWGEALEILQLIEESSGFADPDDIARRLIKLPIRQLVAVCAREAFIPIKRFCETSPALEKHWLRSLKKSGYPDFPIESVDGTSTSSVFAMMLGAYYYRCYEEAEKDVPQSTGGENDAMIFLRLAEDGGIPHAWRDRLKMEAAQFLAIHQAALEEKCHTPDEYKALCTLADQMLQTAQALGNHFWGSGYFSAGVILEKAAMDFVSHPGEKLALDRIAYQGALPASEAEYPLCLRLMLAAVRSYSLAGLLETTENSARITHVFIPDGLFSRSEVSDWEMLRDVILNELQNVFGLTAPQTLVNRVLEEAGEVLQPILDLESDSASEHSFAFGL